MKRVLALSLTAVALVTAAPKLMALQVTLNTGPFTGGNGGGEFVATPIGFTSVLDNYSALAKSATAFDTFCLEFNEHFSPGGTYDVILNTSAVLGGNGGPSDALSVGTAWLYSQFARGTLANYDYATTPARNGDATDLQLTIWWLEGEIGFGDPGSGNDFRNAVITQFTSASGAMADAIPGQYGVMVLNMYAVGHAGDTAYRAQDQLVLVPDGGLTVTLLGMALGSLALVSRKIRK